MNALSLNFCFYMLMGMTAWAPSGPSFQRHTGLTIGSTRGSCVDPSTICQRTLIAHPSDLLTGSKSSDPVVQSLLTRSTVEQAFRALLTRFGPTQVGPKDHFCYLKPPLFPAAPTVGPSPLPTHFLYFLTCSFFLFIYIFYIYILNSLIPNDSCLIILQYLNILFTFISFIFYSFKIICIFIIIINT